MLRPAPWTAFVVTLASLASRAEAAITLEVRVDAQVRADVAVHVGVSNVGDEPAEGAWPEAWLLDATTRGTTPASLPPGFSASWDLTLPRPSELGTFPLVVQLHYADAFGHHSSAPAVHQVRTAGTSPLDVTLSLATEPVATSGTATVRLENREATPLKGTLHAIASIDLTVRPAERPFEIAPQGTLVVPLTIENRDAPPESTAALWVYATLPRGTHVESLAAHGAVPVVASTHAQAPAAGIALPLGIILAVGLALWGARRLIARPRAAATRAERRRGR